MDCEDIVRKLLRARAQVKGVAKDPNEAYRILGADLEILLAQEDRTQDGPGKVQTIQTVTVPDATVD